jgi:amino-acid N-acetyltransferase
MPEPPRQPPVRIRVTKLQEAQLPSLVRIEEAVAALQAAIGLAAEPRTVVAIASLTRTHDVLVAEADHEASGYLAWADEAPGVAWLPTLMVNPAVQRFGIGTRLLRDLGERAVAAGVAAVVTPCWDLAAGAMAFLGVRGFAPLDAGGLPDKLVRWRDRRAAAVVQPGQKLWWAQTDGLGLVPGIPRPS